MLEKVLIGYRLKRYFTLIGACLIDGAEDSMAEKNYRASRRTENIQQPQRINADVSTALPALFPPEKIEIPGVRP
jgi:hypothetical protein